MNDIVPLKYRDKAIIPHKSAISPEMNSRNVLTATPWDFVDLWLKRNGHKTALFYWGQAREFHRASIGLPTQSAPLLLYYSFMNATKALLASKGIQFNEYHGVSDGTATNSLARINLKSVKVKIKTQGILPALSAYYGETETKMIHSLQDLLFNLPYIHRTYCLTYPNQTDMYIPLKDSAFVVNKNTRQVYFSGTLSKDFSNSKYVKRLPVEYAVGELRDGCYSIRSIDFVPIVNCRAISLTELNSVVELHQKLRKTLQYINGAQTLWYLKSKIRGAVEINRFPATITLAAMHRLSELSRYQPLKLESFLNSQKNWLLSEFISQSPGQFIDEISSEITGHQFLIPNVRSAT